jgi:hypothetical protein
LSVPPEFEDQAAAHVEREIHDAVVWLDELASIQRAT